MNACRTLAFAIAAVVAPSARSEEPAPPFEARLETGASFLTKDSALQRLHDAAERVLAGNVVRFTPSMDVLVEGGGYPNAWIETQPMGGEMFAKRDPQVALNNQLIFLLTQRADGRLPGMVISGETVRKQGWDKSPPEAHVWMPGHDIMADFEMFQGFCFPEPAWRMYHWMGRDKAYLQKLHDVLAAHDAYLWRTRDSNGDGLLETWCVWDTGEDSANRFAQRWVPSRWPFEKPPGTPGLPAPENPKDYASYWFHPLAENQQRPTTDMVMAPFASMDVMAYSYSARATLAVIAKELATGREDHWRARADDVRQRLIGHLWDKERHACFDRDRLGRRLPELIHNNLRCMWHGIFTQDMADAFIRHHLMNPRAFWTPVPLVSVAIDDPLYENAPGNNWSGQPQGLTYQRAIDALERYGHFAEVTLLSNKLLPVLIRNDCRFSQQLDAMTGKPSGQKPDGYGPMALAALEYLSRTQGIHLDVANNRVWWSSADPAAAGFSCTQRWGTHRFELRHSQGGIMTALAGGAPVFTCDAGTRVVTDLDGRVIELHGISPDARTVKLTADGNTHTLSVAPNTIHEPTPTGLRMKSRAPFHPPPQENKGDPEKRDPR
jgi:hypothetical protein